MGIKYLWDTNTAIYYLQQQFPPSAEEFIDSTLSDSIPAISVITEIGSFENEERSSSQ